MESRSVLVAEEKLSPEETFVSSVYERQDSWLRSTDEREPRYERLQAALQNLGIRSICALPLTTVHRRVGAISFGRAQFEHAIAVLIGKPPAEFSLPEVALNYHPPTIPIGLPSDLLQRRPDIAAAERRVAESNQQIGIARAAYFPTVNLSGTVGFAGSQGSNWFGWPSAFGLLVLRSQETLFDAGRRRATSESAARTTMPPSLPIVRPP